MEKGVLIMEKKKPYGTVLIKAADILDFLSNHPDSILQEITEGTKMTPSTTLKILDTLVLIGYVNRKQDKSYRLGSKLIRYANQNLEQLDLVEITQPYLEKLQEQIDETIHLGILANQEILYVNKLEPKNQTIRMSSKIGITRPLYNSAMGKAVLAELSREEIDAYLQEHELIAYTEETITNPLKLKKELAIVQQEKVAFDDEEVEKDIFCIGTAIVSENKVVGAFSISMPKYRMNNDLKERIIHEILSVKNSVENKLNH
ncbi:IclR transcriptional regulator [Enterococcus phoeniculicola]|jgi:IclR family KDG regulon transcriptional repressor|nr:IclR transcriptional regulator [Enterococcus phoeniculicola]